MDWREKRELEEAIARGVQRGLFGSPIPVSADDMGCAPFIAVAVLFVLTAYFQDQYGGSAFAWAAKIIGVVIGLFLTLYLLEWLKRLIPWLIEYLYGPR